jgi:hypothetical protein
MAKDQIQVTPEQLEKANEISFRWQGFKNRIIPGIKDMVGELYIEHILGLGFESSRTFRANCYSDAVADNGDAMNLYEQVGLAQSDVKPSATVLANFWIEVNLRIPQLVANHEEVSFLVNHGGAKAVFTLLDSLQGHEMGLDPKFSSPVLKALGTNAHLFR